MTTFATGKTGTIGKFLPENIVSINLDLESEISEFLDVPLSSEDVVIHLAAVVGNNLVEESIDYAHKINVLGTKKLGIAAKEKNIKKFFYISTSHVYENSLSLKKENDKTSPISAYAIQKLEGEKIVESIFQNHPRKLCILRIFSLLDLGMPEHSLGGAIEKLLPIQSQSTLKHGEDVRDFLTPLQVAEVIVHLTKIEDAFGIINVCSGVATTIRSAAMRMINPSDIERIQLRIDKGNSNYPKIVGDNSKLKSLLPKYDLNWKPQPFPIFS